jgi:hypothetical protein
MRRINQVRLTRHQVPHAPVEPGGVDANQYLVIADLRPVDLRYAEHVGRSVLGLDDRPHPRAELPFAWRMHTCRRVLVHGTHFLSGQSV